MLNERKKSILAAVIEDYVLTAEPVGSRRLVEKYQLGVSPATVRNELAALEEMGYLVQPHPSAGRIPTDIGYRHYVDSLVDAKPLPASEREAITTYYSEFNREIEDLMRQTSVLLSGITSYAAIVFAPALRSDRLKHLDLVTLSPRLVLLVAITSAGSVAKKMIRFEGDIPADDLRRYEVILNEKLVGLTSRGMRVIDFNSSPTDEPVLNLFHSSLMDLVTESGNDRVFYDGAVNLLAQPEFESLKRVRQLLSTLERGYKLLETLSDAAEQYRLIVKIGSENGPMDIDGLSLVAASYRVEGESSGALGILGPTRMNYPRAIAAVQYIADNLSDVLETINKRG